MYDKREKRISKNGKIERGKCFVKFEPLKRFLEICFRFWRKYALDMLLLLYICGSSTYEKIMYSLDLFLQRIIIWKIYV